MIWLKVFGTNSDPKVIASYYMDTMKFKKGCPARTRVDAGTENGHVCQMQREMRWDHVDELARKSCIVGSSNHNQCIESWWVFLDNTMHSTG